MTSLYERFSIFATGFLVAFVLTLLVSGPAHAQQSVLPGYQVCSAASGSTQCSFQPISVANPLPVSTSGGVAVGGFTPAGTFATLTASGSSGSVALPAGTTVAFQNTGTTAVSCTLGVGSATAVVSQVVIQASSTVFMAPGLNTFGACIDQTGSVSNVVVLAGGSGLGTGFGGGGGSSGGGAVTIADGANVTQGAIADAASTAGGTGTTSAKLRLMTTQLGTLNTTLGSPFQAGGSIANTSFGATQATASNLNATVVGTGTFVTQSTLAAETTKVIGTVNQGTSPWVISGALTANQSVNVAQFGGVSTSTGQVAVSVAPVTATNTALVTALRPDSPGIVTLGQTTKASSVPVAIASDQLGGATVANSLSVVAASQYPANATAAAVPITATATGTTAATTATLAGVASKTTYLCGFSIRANATAAATGNATVTGTITGTLNFTQWTAPLASGIGLVEPNLGSTCVPASAANTGIAVISAAPGAGGVVSVTAWGYQL